MSREIDILTAAEAARLPDGTEIRVLRLPSTDRPSRMYKARVGHWGGGKAAIYDDEAGQTSVLPIVESPKYRFFRA
jgi:hypothetical protein